MFLAHSKLTRLINPQSIYFSFTSSIAVNPLQQACSNLKMSLLWKIQAILYQTCSNLKISLPYKIQANSSNRQDCCKVSKSFTRLIQGYCRVVITLLQNCGTMFVTLRCAIEDFLFLPFGFPRQNNEKW